MEQETIFNEEIKDTETLYRLYEESLDRIREGELVEGEVVDLENNNAVIDIGFKSTGNIPLSEFADQGSRDIKVGDKMEVLLVQREDKNGHPVLSKRKAEELKTLRNIEDVYRNNGSLKGKIVSEVKGGFQVDIGLPAFLPVSQIDFKPVRDTKSWIGTEHEFKILKYDRQDRNVVVSRRKYLEEDLRKEVRRLYKEGEVYTGTVSDITDFGLFIDLGIIRGLVHKSNISWGKVDHPSHHYQVGEQVSVKVLDIDEDSLRLALGIKQLEPNPWETIAAKYPVGTVIEGEIRNIQDFGIFIGIDEGIDGLIHMSNISWTRTANHPGELFEKGQTIRAMILDIDQDNERLSLGIKQLTPDPWQHISTKYRPGTHATGRIIRIPKRGLIVRLEEGVEGIIPASRLPKTEENMEFRQGDDIEVKIVSISEKSKKVELTIPKQQDENETREEVVYDESLARRLQEAMTKKL